jgi:hypothetical protein
VEARVDDLHSRIAQRTCDDLRPPVVPVETGFRYDDTNLAGHRDEYMSVKLTVVGCSPALAEPRRRAVRLPARGPGAAAARLRPGRAGEAARARGLAAGGRDRDHALAPRSLGRPRPGVWGTTVGPGAGGERPELWVPPEGRELLCSIGGRLGQPEMFEEAFRPARVRRRRAFEAAASRSRPPRPALPAARVRLPRLARTEPWSAIRATRARATR